MMIPNLPADVTSDPRWAWAEFTPDKRRPWTLPLAGHLFRRAAFAARWEQLEQAVGDGPRRAVDLLMRPSADVAAFEQVMNQDEDAVARSSGIDSMRAWWLRRLIQTPHPLREKMTLFWHSHFGVSNHRVNSSMLMMRHVRMLREHSLGSYRPLLEAVSLDPAMLTAVGAEKSRKAQPNENFTRRLLEQFSMGPGHFDERDVREAARAFTGLFVLRGRVRYISHEHDTGSKNVLGKKGSWDAKDIVRIVLQQPATPRLLARKLYRWFISEVDDPTDGLIDPLAQMLTAQYDVGQVVETILRSNLFYSDVAYRRRIKSPVEYSLGIIRGLGGSVATLPLGGALAQIGQELYAPPTTKGWVGGRYWINAVTMLGREKLASALLEPNGPYGNRLDPAAVVERRGHASPEAGAKSLIGLFLQDDLPPQVRSELLQSVPAAEQTADSKWLREFAVRVVTLPAFHLC